MGTRRSFPRAEANHSLPSTVKVKNEWSNTSTLPTCLHGMHKDNAISFLPQGTHILYSCTT
jgi:hypothetical protein